MSIELANHWWPTFAAVCVGGFVTHGELDVQFSPSDHYADVAALTHALIDGPGEVLDTLDLPRPSRIVGISTDGATISDELEEILTRLIDCGERIINPSWVNVRPVEVDGGEEVLALIAECVIALDHLDEEEGDSTPAIVAAVWSGVPLSGPMGGWAGDTTVAMSATIVADGDDGVRVWAIEDLAAVAAACRDPRLRAVLEDWCQALWALTVSGAVAVRRGRGQDHFADEGFDLSLFDDIIDDDGIAMSTHGIDCDDERDVSLAEAAFLRFTDASVESPEQALTVLRRSGARTPMSAIGGLLLAHAMPEDLAEAGWSISAVMGDTGGDRVLAIHPQAGAYLVHLSGADNLVIERLGLDSVPLVVSADAEATDHDGLVSALAQTLRELARS